MSALLRDRLGEFEAALRSEDSWLKGFSRRLAYFKKQSENFSSTTVNRFLLQQICMFVYPLI